MARDCEHGQLARSCEICELEDEVARLRKGIAAHSCGISHGCDCVGDHHDPDNTACRYGQPFESERKLKELL